jgi:undecaprenyl-diphosphatase
MYLGVHTPLDVVVSLLIALGLILLLRPVFETDESFKKYMPYVVIGSVIISVLFLVYVLSLGGVSFLDSHNYQSGLKNAYTLLGCTAGLVVVYFVDSKYINFDTKAKWYAQILKLVIGLAGVLAIKSGLSAPLTALFGNEYIARAVRYFLIVVFAGAVWPMTFKKFAKL